MHHFCLISVLYYHLFPAAMVVSRASGDPGGHRSTLTKEGSIHVPSVPGRRDLLTAPPPLRSTPAPAGHNNPRRSPPASPVTDTQSSPSRICRTGRGPPAPGRTSGDRAPPGVALWRLQHLQPGCKHFVDQNALIQRLIVDLLMNISFRSFRLQLFPKHTSCFCCAGDLVLLPVEWCDM